MSFFSEFFDIADQSGEHKVCCPFEHKTSTGITYQENNPSAHVNIEKQVFHCKSCGEGMHEQQFVSRVLGCSAADAFRILRLFDNAESRLTWVTTRQLEEETRSLAHSLGISDEVLEELNVTTYLGETNKIQFPVFLQHQLMDIRTYTPGADPTHKMRSRSGSMMGLIIPYDLWVETPPERWTLFCAGEKDMAVARSNGFNAITLTGGEKMLPRINNAFIDRRVAICYDNDTAGREGAIALAKHLWKYTHHIKIITGFHEVCKEEKEDITDFFVKYAKTKEDLIHYIETSEFFEPTEEEVTKAYPNCDLYTAATPKFINKMVQSNIQVVAITDTTFSVPNSIILEKYKLSGDRDNMHLGECKHWELDEDRVGDTLHMMDNNFKEETINQNIRDLMFVGKTERFVKQRVYGTVTVYKANVTDMFETNVESAVPMEFIAYSFGCKLESGQKYLVTYKLVPHPYKGQQLVMLITDAKQANDSVSNFTVTEEVKQDLNLFKDLQGTVSERIDLLIEHVKGLLGYNGNNTLIKTIDFSYHTALQFNFGSFDEVRGYLDTLIVGESRTGKSSTANTLRKEYGLGVFASLAGNSATIAGLIGGSNKTASGGFQTRAGVIPQNHRGLVIFEEFGKCKQDIVSELTDIRSSNEVRIARVSGTITLPALVRMISLTNAKTTNGNIKSIAMYPNGISIVTELVGTAEDIARYDLVVVLSDRGNSQIDPFWEPTPPLPTRAYQNRVRWVWSRHVDQIQISREVGLYIMERANALNADFDCHIKLFGTEAWKKLARLSISVAGYLVSTDETYTNIIVTKEHVDYAENFYREIYDNNTFKLREYVTHERVYSTIDEDGITALQDIYTKFPALIQQLERAAVCSKNMLASASGLPPEDLNRALSRLTKGFFVQYQGYDIVPTERFRIGLGKINKETVTARLGE